MAKLIYLKFKTTIARNSGGLISSEILDEVFKSNDICEKTLYLVSLPNFIRSSIASLFRLNENCIYLLQPSYDGGVKDYLKFYINKYILQKKLKKHCIYLMDGLLPISDFRFLITYRLISFIRSSLSCFAYTTKPLRIEFFSTQLCYSYKLICASVQIYYNWLEKINSNDKVKPIINLPVPLKNLLTTSAQDSTAKNNLDLFNNFVNDKPINILLVFGASGPRKGVTQLLNGLIGKTNNMHFHLFGQMRENLSINDHQNITLHKFINIDFMMKVNLPNVIRVFPSHSECYSRAQLEAILSGDNVLINAESIDPLFINYVSSESICFGIQQMINKLLKIDSGYSCKLNSENFDEMKLKYVEKFNVELGKILNERYS